MPTALVTGASRGLGAATAHALARRGWDLVVDARDARALDAEVARWRTDPQVPTAVSLTAVAGDVTELDHLGALAAEVERHGRLDLLINNASALGPSPLPPLATLDLGAFTEVLATNVVAPLGLVQRVLPALEAAAGAVVDITSDAAVEPYPGWGGYGASKAALDQLTAILGAEHPRLAVYAFDPGDLRTAMHQAAFPGEDISDRPEPATVVPALLHLLDQRPPSGRYRASDLLVGAGGAS
jgi:NAD(P)-dependent dehydrogenase (short-subunit alcohol dehydrogenase family)